MTDRRGSRFVLEVLFLIALTVALTFANLPPLEIAGIMLVGWAIVALLEWVAWRDEPHYGSGLPPRYYVPQVNLPPAQPLELVSAGYPEVRDEAPTWIASPALRAEMLGAEQLGEWPVAAPPVSETPSAVEPESDPAPDPWTRAEELPVAPLGELDPVAPEPSPQPEPERAPPAFIPPPVSAPVAAAVVPRPEPEPVPEPAAVDEPSLDVELARSVHGVKVMRVARYSLDPLGDVQPRRRFSRGSAAEPEAVEVPARPEGIRALPGRTNRQD